MSFPDRRPRRQACFSSCCAELFVHLLLTSGLLSVPSNQPTQQPVILRWAFFCSSCKWAAEHMRVQSRGPLRHVHAPNHCPDKRQCPEGPYRPARVVHKKALINSLPGNDCAPSTQIPELLSSVPDHMLKKLQSALRAVWHRFAYTSHPLLRQGVERVGVVCGCGAYKHVWGI